MAKSRSATADEGSAPPAWLELIGMESVLASWRAMVASGRLPSVLLLVGRDGIGKRSLLAALAAMHFCERATACGACGNCLWLISGSHPEVLWLEPGDGAFLSAHATQLQEHLALSPGSGAKARVVVVVDADRLTETAANRLLKTLEEPPPSARVFFSTSRIGAMLPTVLSRLVRWQLPPPPLAASVRWLQGRLAGAGKETAAPELLAAILRRHGLAPGSAWREIEADADAVRFDLGTLATARTPAQVLDWAEQRTRREGWSAGALLSQWEMALNEQYRQAMQAGGRPAVSLLARSKQRQLLRQARQLVRGARVPLNAQLLCEALALAQRS